MDSFEVHRALGALFDALALANRHMQHLAPWSSSASSTVAHRALFHSAETLRIVGVLMQPFMPTKARHLLDALGVDVVAGRTWENSAFGRGIDSRSSNMILGQGKLAQLFPAIKVEIKVDGSQAG